MPPEEGQPNGDTAPSGGAVDTDPNPPIDVDPNPEVEGEDAPNTPTSIFDFLNDDSLKGTKTLEKFKSPDELAKSYIELEKHSGGTVKVPGEGATKEDWDKFYNKLGRPESSEGYQLQKPEDTDAVKWDDSFEKAFLPAAHALGLTNKQVQGLVDWQRRLVQESVDSLSKQREETTEQLRREYGGATEKNLALAFQAVKRFGGEEAAAAFNETGLGNHPALVKMMVNISKNLLEDTLVGESMTSLETPDQAKQKIEQIRADKEHPFHKGAGAPGYDTALKEWTRLHEVAFG